MAAATVGDTLIRAGEDREDGRQPGHSTSPEPASSAERPLRVLIVEDEAIVAMSLGAVLEQFGHEVAGTVATGRGAVSEAARLEPDLVLMDVRLADSLDGISAAERIMAERSVGLIFITAYSDAATVARMRELGAPIVSKPVAADALHRAIAAVRPRGGPSSGPKGESA